MKTSKVVKKNMKTKYNDYRDEDIEEKEKFINEKLSELPIHQLVKQTILNELLCDFKVVSLYPSGMWEEKSINFRIETGYVYTRDMIDELVGKFKTGNFTQGSATLKN